MSAKEAFDAAVEVGIKDKTIQSPVFNRLSVLKLKAAADRANTNAPKAEITVVEYRYPDGDIQYALEIGEYICNPFKNMGIPLYNGLKKNASLYTRQMKPCKNS